MKGWWPCVLGRSPPSSWALYKPPSPKRRLSSFFFFFFSTVSSPSPKDASVELEARATATATLLLGSSIRPRWTTTRTTSRPTALRSPTASLRVGSPLAPPWSTWALLPPGGARHPGTTWSGRCATPCTSTSAALASWHCFTPSRWDQGRALPSHYCGFFGVGVWFFFFNSKSFLCITDDAPERWLNLVTWSRQTKSFGIL